MKTERVPIRFPESLMLVSIAPWPDRAGPLVFWASVAPSASAAAFTFEGP